MWDQVGAKTGVLSGVCSPPGANFQSPHASAGTTPSPRSGSAGRRSDDSLVDQLIAEGRWALLLRPQICDSLSRDKQQQAAETFLRSASEVPCGDVLVRPWTSGEIESLDEIEPQCVHVEPLYIDRLPITNRLYQTFVTGGGYQQPSLWRTAVRPRIEDFTDSTGQSGPQGWANGRFPAGLADHPVVGVSWFEADAYARWAGKRLPCDAEWVKAASCPISAAGSRPVQRRYPWGETFDHSRANLWISQRGSTVPVEDYSEGVTAGGVYQMVGNIWEWTSSEFCAWVEGVQVELERPLISIRGAAFDTYFDSQADCQAQSADDPFARQGNLGFRCALSACDVAERYLPS